MKAFAVGLVAGLALLAPVAAFGQAPPAPPGAKEAVLDVSPRRVSPGQEVTASGEGCAPEVAVEFRLYGPDLISTGEIPSSETGYFEADVQIPAEVPAGRAWLVADCLDADQNPLVLEQTIVVTRPSVVITGINLMFGGGVTLIVAGVGVMLRRRLPSRRRRRVPRP